MSETSKRGSLKSDILHAVPAFKTIDELAKILSECDAAKRKEELKNWYMTGEGLHGMPPQKQEAMFAKSKDYPQYLNEVAAIDGMVSKNIEAFRDSLLIYFERLTERERASLEDKMKIAESRARESEDFVKQNKDYLMQAQKRETEVEEKGKRYDTELARVGDFEAKLKKRTEELGVLQSGLEKRSQQLTKGQETLKGGLDELQQREIALTAQELESDKRAKEISEALSYAAAFRKYAETKGKELYASVDGLAKYFKDILSKVPVNKAPVKKAEDDILMPGPDAGETMLGMGGLPPAPK